MSLFVANCYRTMTKEIQMKITNELSKKKKISGYGYTAWHPFSSFMVNFKETKEPDAPEESQVYEVERDTFLRQMKEWGIKIEGTDEFQ